jgi:hypothetical protein
MFSSFHDCSRPLVAGFGLRRTPSGVQGTESERGLTLQREHVGARQFRATGQARTGRRQPDAPQAASTGGVPTGGCTRTSLHRTAKRFQTAWRATWRTGGSEGPAARGSRTPMPCCKTHIVPYTKTRSFGARLEVLAPI